MAACSEGDIAETAQRGQASVAQPASSSELALIGPVTDAADILPWMNEVALTRQLAELERRTGHQLVVVTVPSLGGEDVAAYTLRHANRWGIGRKGYDDGVVLLVAPNERRVRIEVGRGLEQTLSNHMCSTILQEQVLPRFRDGDLAAGIEAGVTSLVQRLQ